MIQFPDEAAREWQLIADASKVREDVKRRIERGTLTAAQVEKLRIAHDAKQILQQELDADSTPVLEMMTLADYQSNPAAAPTSMIDGVMNENGLTLMLGPSGSGKSTLALQMLHSLMTGSDFLGQTAHRINGGVGILSYDMDGSMVLDWMNGMPNIDPAKIALVNAHKRGNPLNVPQMRAQIAANFCARGVEVILVDSFSASFFGLDQNDAGATMAHYRDMQKFALTECCAKSLIMVVHSTEANPNKARGSTVHHDVADGIVGVAGTGIEPRTVHMVKYRAAMGQHQMNECIVTAPDSVTHLVSLDTGAMALAGMKVNAGAAAFLPQPHSAPDTDREEDEEGEDL